MMSREKIGSAGQVEIVVARGRQSLSPFVITFAQSEQSNDEREKELM